MGDGRSGRGFQALLENIVEFNMQMYKSFQVYCLLFIVFCFNAEKEKDAGLAYSLQCVYMQNPF